jgi:hypothetical protein
MLKSCLNLAKKESGVFGWIDSGADQFTDEQKHQDCNANKMES